LTVYADIPAPCGTRQVFHSSRSRAAAIAESKRLAIYTTGATSRATCHSVNTPKDVSFNDHSPLNDKFIARLRTSRGSSIALLPVARHRYGRRHRYPRAHDFAQLVGQVLGEVGAAQE